jgi:hypothetical protein
MTNPINKFTISYARKPDYYKQHSDNHLNSSEVKEKTLELAKGFIHPIQKPDEATFIAKRQNGITKQATENDTPKLSTSCNKENSLG